ncbi:MAG: efflux RND transporter periplasmic adaptor subunit [Myxococcales bacterium]
MNCVVVLVLLAAVTLSACNKKDAASSGKRGLRQASFPVETLRVEAVAHPIVISAPGVVDAFERVQITARVSGVIDRVAFVEGQEIKRRQVLVLIDSRRYALGVSSARASVAKAEATAADVAQSLARRENASASNPGLIPGEEIETYRTRLRTARADVASAGEALKLAQLNMDDSSIKAPTEGVVQTRSVETGQYVQAGTVIATLLQREPMLLRFHVTTAEAPRLKVGLPVEFSLKESQQVYTAKITLIAAAAEAESRLVPVTAEVDSDRKFWLRPGSFAQVRIRLVPNRTFPMIPQTATRPSDRGFLAYVVEGDTVRERVLQLGAHSAEGLVEVRDGVKAGDLLVTRGLEALADGTKVQVVEPASSSAPLPEADAGEGKGEGKGRRSRADGGTP